METESFLTSEEGANSISRRDLLRIGWQVRVPLKLANRWRLGYGEMPRRGILLSGQNSLSWRAPDA